MLKVVALDAAGFTEKRNLRVPGKPGLNFSTNDIRWHPRTSSGTPVDPVMWLALTGFAAGDAQSPSTCWRRPRPTVPSSSGTSSARGTRTFRVRKLLPSYEPLRSRSLLTGVRSPTHRLPERVLNGHRRAVNRICWHTTEWNVLISGSQDGTIKLWVRDQALVLAKASL